MRPARWLSRLFRRDRAEAELDKELAYHMDRREQELITGGASATEARRQVRLEFGGSDQIKEECRDARGTRWVENLIGDVSYAFRVLRQRPSFAAVAILSLALGTGANTAAFQLLDAVRLRKLPVPDADELVEVHIAGGNRGFGRNRPWNSMTYPMWEQVRENQTELSGVFAWSPEQVRVGERPNDVPARGAWVSGEAFPVLQLSSHAGRLFTPEDDVAGCAANVVLSHAFWQNRFGADRDVLDSTLMINGRLFTVIGVTPPGFTGMEVGRPMDLAMPFCVRGNWDPSWLESRDRFWLKVFGRMHPGGTTQAVSAYFEPASIGWFEAAAPDGYDQNWMKLWNIFRLTATGRASGGGDLRDNLGIAAWLLLGTTSLVLLIACVNLANLTLARSLARGPEIKTRLALGASRWRIVSQLFVESLLLATVGALAGAALAGFLSQGLMNFVNMADSTIRFDLGFDWRQASFVIFIAVLAAILIGLMTAIYATRERNVIGANAITHGTGTDRQRFWLQKSLVTVQVAISLVLVVTSIFFITSFRNLLGVDAGFRQEGLVASYLGMQQTQVTPEGLVAMKRSILEGIRTIPGVENTATTSLVPLTGSGWELQVLPTGADTPLTSEFSWVSPSYFETLQIPLLAGRGIADLDTETSARVLVVNENFTNRFFAGENPVGRRVRSLAEPGYEETEYEIVGLVGNTKSENLEEAPLAIAYASYTQDPDKRPQMRILTRTSLPAATFSRSLESALNDSHPGVINNATLDLREQVLDSLRERQMVAWLTGFFGILAAGLVGVGLYGIVSYLVSRRLREIGVRMALGATTQRVVRMIVGQTAVWTILGCVIGGLGAFALARLAESILFGIAPGEPWVFAMGALLLTVVAILAAWVPTRRAARANPLETLRTE